MRATHKTPISFAPLGGLNFSYLCQSPDNQDRIEEINTWINYLRVSVADSSRVDRDRLTALGAAGIFDVAGGVQVVYGAKADLYKGVIAQRLGLDD